jgi:alanine racemase
MVIMSQSPNKVFILLSALGYNLSRIRELVGEKTKIMGVIKSDAYGHGLIPVARKLQALGIDTLGVNYISEALSLRVEGITSPVAILLGISTSREAQQVAENDFIPVVFDLESARLLSAEGQKRGKTVTCFLKIDTGMGRLGIDSTEIGPFLEQLVRLKGLRVEGLFSHLSSADEEDTEFTEGQIKNFKEAISAGRGFGLALTMNSLTSSAGIIKYKESFFDLVRPGIILYGGLPFPGFMPALPLKPLMSFQSAVAQVREVKPGTPISYGRTFCTDSLTKIAIISAGYADGLSRTMSNQGHVLIRGQRAPLIGRICMNLTIADVSAIGGVRKGDKVYFLGGERAESITPDDMARWADTISYEVLCSIGSRNIREYVDETEVG